MTVGDLISTTAGRVWFKFETHRFEKDSKAFSELYKNDPVWNSGISQIRVEPIPRGTLITITLNNSMYYPDETTAIG